MASVLPLSQPPLLTAEDLEGPNAPRGTYELWDGVLVVREPAGGWAGEVGARVMAPLAAHVWARDLGWALLAEQGFVVARNPDRVLEPDGAYVSKKRLARIPDRGFVPFAPDFVLEVRSPTDSWLGVVEKCGIWIAHGVEVVWGVDPESRVVAVFRPREEPRVAGLGATIDAAPALPDFRMRVDDVLAGLLSVE
jgi:Uma2 family endonuclease